MQFSVIHELDNRMRVQLAVRHLCIKQADTLQYYLECIGGIDSVSIYERAGSVAIEYNNQLLGRADLIHALRLFSFDNTDVPSEYLDNSSRELDLYYKEKILSRVIKRFTVKTIMPTFLRGIFIYKRVDRFVYAGLRSLLSGHLRVEVLDATAVSVAILQGNSQGAGSIMFLLDIGELLEEWTHKRTVRDLARSMSLSTTTVWKVEDNTEYQVSSDTVLVGDTIKVYMGTTIPFDGIVVAGEASVNESSLIGEPVAKFKHESSLVYAGSVVEDGEVVFEVTQTASNSRYEQIVVMIEETEALKSNVESSASHLADRLVPYSLATSALVYLLSGNAIKATSVLMVDYCCALKLSMPIAVLACI